MSEWRTYTYERIADDLRTRVSEQEFDSAQIPDTSRLSK